MIAKSKPENQQKRRKRVEAQLEEVVKLLVFWRDGVQCVQQATDGVRCGGPLMWMHYIAQGQSNWLKYELGNVFVGCREHNGLDYRGDKSYAIWFSSMFGNVAAQMMDAERDAHRQKTGGKRRTVQELEDMLARYTAMYETRYGSYELEEMIRLGYYGEIIKAAWEQEGRL